MIPFNPPISVQNSPLDIIEVITYDPDGPVNGERDGLYDVFTVVQVRNRENGHESELAHYVVADHPELLESAHAYLMANNREAFDQTTRIRDFEVALREAVDRTLEDAGIRRSYGIGTLHYGESISLFSIGRYSLCATYSEENELDQLI